MRRQVGYVVIGVSFYTLSTDWTVLESLYFVIVTLTSVGYGDLTPVSAQVKLFTCAYILLGVGILGTALGEVVSSLKATRRYANSIIIFSSVSRSA